MKILSRTLTRGVRLGRPLLEVAAELLQIPSEQYIEPSPTDLLLYLLSSDPAD